MYIVYMPDPLGNICRWRNYDKTQQDYFHYSLFTIVTSVRVCLSPQDKVINKIEYIRSPISN